MKARVPLYGAAKRQVEYETNRISRMQRGHIVQCMMLLFGKALMDGADGGKPWGPRKVERLMDRVYQLAEELFVFYRDEWTDAVQAEMEKRGIEFDKNYWLIPKKDGERTDTPLPELTPEQIAYIKESRERVFSDAESKLIHDGWKYL